MPLLTIKTNAELPEGKAALMIPQLSRVVADMLGKPENYVMVSLETNRYMSFSGDTGPLAYLELKSIGLREQDTITFSEALCDLMEFHLGVNRNRVYIEFTNAPRHLWGWNGATF
jgi:phenylpyruvate tautomerase